jgi:hypothetical protein
MPLSVIPGTISEAFQTPNPARVLNAAMTPMSA